MALTPMPSEFCTWIPAQPSTGIPHLVENAGKTKVPLRLPGTDAAAARDAAAAARDAAAGARDAAAAAARDEAAARDRDVTVPSAYADGGTGRPCMLATCWCTGSVRVPNRTCEGYEQRDAGHIGHRQRGHPPPPRPGGGKGRATHGGDMCTWGHPDIRDLPRGRPDTTGGVHG